MKSTLFIITLMFPFYELFAQAPAIDDLKHYRIQLDNRTNQHLKDVPKQLLEGYCKGIYKAYYPNSIFTEVNFGDFLAQFKWSEPLLNESVMCGDDYCSNPAFIELFSRFNLSLDYYEQNYYNKQTARMERKIPFVQLVYSVEVDGKIYSFRGPLFRMDEIEKSILINNEGNDSQAQSIKYTFDLARFYSVEITKDDLKTKEKRTNQDDDHLEH